MPVAEEEYGRKEDPVKRFSERLEGLWRACKSYHKQLEVVEDPGDLEELVGKVEQEILEEPLQVRAMLAGQHGPWDVYFLGLTNLVEKDYESAKTFFENACNTLGEVAKNKDSGFSDESYKVLMTRLHTKRGIALYKLGQIKNAELFLGLAVQDELAPWDAHYYLGRIYFSKGRYDDAVVQFEDAVSKIPMQSPKVCLFLGKAYEKTGKLDDAFKMYNYGVGLSLRIGDRNDGVFEELFARSNALKLTQKSP